MAKASLFLRLLDRANRKVEGECLDSDHEGEIDINSWSWSVADPANKAKEEVPQTDAAVPPSGSRSSAPSRPAAAGGADAKVAPDLFTFSKKLDKSSVRMMKAIDTGEVFSKATIVLEEEFKEAPSPFYLEINLTDVFFVKLDMTIDGSSGVEFRENWSITYTTIKFTYRLRGEAQGQRNGGRGAMFDMQFSRSKGSAATPSRKSPQTPAEIAAQKKKDFDEYQRQQNQRQQNTRSGR